MRSLPRLRRFLYGVVAAIGLGVPESSRGSEGEMEVHTLAGVACGDIV